MTTLGYHGKDANYMTVPMLVLPDVEPQDAR